MPDTLDLYSKIDSLVCHTDEILKYVHEQETPPEIHPSYGVPILLAVIFFTIIFILIRKIRRKDKDDELIKVKRNNYIELIFWIIAVSLIFFAFFKFGLIHNQKVFALSQPDLLFAIALIFTIVGAFWSVLSRIESTKAFKQSEKTFNSFGSTYGFISFFDEKRLPEVYKKIGKPYTAVTLYIGFPIVGLPYIKSKTLNTTSLFDDLISHLKRIQTELLPDKEINYTLNIGYINFVESKNLLDDILEIKNILNEIVKIDTSIKETLTNKLINRNINFDESSNLLNNISEIENLLQINSNDKKVLLESKLNGYKLLLERLIEFYRLVNYFYPKDATTQKRNNKYKNVKFVELDMKEKFRFVTSKELNSGEIIDKRTFVWVVNLKEESKGVYKPFDSVVFQTQEDKFLTLLEDVF